MCATRCIEVCVLVYGHVCRCVCIGVLQRILSCEEHDRAVGSTTHCLIYGGLICGVVWSGV